MVHIRNYARDVETGAPFTTGNCVIKDASGATISSPALNPTTGLWEYQANGQPGIISQTYVASSQTKIVNGDATGQAGDWCESELSRILQLFGDGVINGLAASAPGSMNVQIGVGNALNLGVLHPIYTAENVTIGAADPTNPRIDRVVSRLTRTSTFAGRVVLAVVAGSPAASPAAPALTQDATTWEVELARVTVPAAASSIVIGNIDTTQRPIATGPLVDGSVTSAKIADGTIQLVDLASGVIIPALMPGLINAHWYGPRDVIGGLIANILNVSQNVLYGAPIYIPKATTLTGLAIRRAAGGTNVSATARLGLFGVASNGLPNPLHTDGGTVNVSTSGVKSITGLSAPLAAGWYWATTCFGSFSGTLPIDSMNGVSASQYPRAILGSPTVADDYFNWCTQASFPGTGALPASYPSPSVANIGPLVWIQTSGT